MVSAWCAGRSMVLGQLITSEKSNEITAIPELLNLLSIKSSIITIGCYGMPKEDSKTNN